MVDTELQTEYGLQTPDGKVSWGAAIDNRPINSPDERQMLLLVLRKTAQQLGWPEEEFLSHFHWVPRTVQRLDRTHALDDVEVVPPIENAAQNGQ